MHDHLIEKLNRYKHIIWDWNGTLLDDVELCFSILTEILIEQGLDLPTLEEYRSVFRFPVKEYYEDVGIDFEKVSFEKLSKKFIELYDQKVKEQNLFDGVKSFLDTLYSNEKRLSILSAANHNHLNEIVRHFEIHHYFDNIFGIPNFHAESKMNRGFELLKDHPVSKEKTVLIGDTDHDLEVGKELGIDVILIADGHQNYERLKKVHDQVIETRFVLK